MEVFLHLAVLVGRRVGQVRRLLPLLIFLHEAWTRFRILVNKFGTGLIEIKQEQNEFYISDIRLLRV